MILLDRQRLQVTAVSEVLHFEEEAVALATPLGVLMVQGRGLKLKGLNPEGGRVTVEGDIDLLTYQQPRSRGLFRRSSP